MDLKYYLSHPLELDKICRACLGAKGDMKPLYGACLGEMLQTVADIQVKEGDNLPSLMCVQCVLQCSRAFTFKQLCEKSNNILKEFTSAEFQHELAKHLEQENIKKSLREQLQFQDGPAHEENSEDNIINPDYVVYQEADAEIVEVQDFKITEEFYVVQEIVTEDDGSQGFITPEEIEEKPRTEHMQTEMPLVTLVDQKPAQTKEKSSSKKGTAPKKFECTECGARFALKVDLKIHQMTHPRENKFECTVCHKSFSEIRVLKRHSKIHLTDKPHKCDQCDMSFAESSNLTKHKKRHTGELRNVQGKPHLCSVCGRAFKWASSLHKHMKYHTGHKLFSCEYCSKQYVEARSLEIHVRSHTGVRPYTCEICQKKFTQRCNLDKHIRVHTGERPYKCPVCNKRFSQSGYIGVHMRTHTGDKPFVCQICGKSFAGSNTLTTHMRTHSGEKPYACDTCGKCFSRQESLVVHKRSIHGEPPYEKPHFCVICNKPYVSLAQLAAHLKTHPNSTLVLRCEICPKRFNSSARLNMHYRKCHDPVKAIFCKLCDKNFSQVTQLNKHMNTAHANSLENATIDFKAADLAIGEMHVAEIVTSDNQTMQLEVTVEKSI